ncbi:MAG: hypothetical protein AVDCRST_MAG56-8027 [uncultured Cytophagales bacterium]|uniref:IPT/TIG domain-containing protein n=1 Tax=uncultured Cytophagales bacterium TaxID=158755 RepID=A0A6J4M176_9SPHI|nr:MAG: hypothetical protein AVDCRST_MAG56-8027 [uncultured Cytophagales bacterium]
MQKAYFSLAASRLCKTAPAPFRLLTSLLAALCLLASPGFAQEVLWGLTFGAGPGGAGTAFSLRADGSEFTVRKAFQLPPSGPGRNLVQGPDGNFYGTTGGGSSGLGTLFRVGPDGTGFAVLKTFTDAEGSVSPRVLGPDGYFYGTGGGPNGTGAFVKIRPDGTDFTVLREFSGAFTTGLMRGSDGVFYGTTGEGSDPSNAIYRINADGTGFAVLRALSFAEGSNLSGDLLEGTDGFLYGTASMGGANGEYGSIYRIRPDGSDFAVIKSFAGSSAADGAGPRSGVVQGADGSFYGTTAAGGSERAGTVFKINGDGTGFTLLKNLTQAEGADVFVGGLLVAPDGNLYGTIYAGGTGYGSIYKIAPDGSNFAVLKNFTGADGWGPRGSLLQGSDGSLYGTTERGGTADYGTVFKLSPDGSGFALLTSFQLADGATGYALGTLLQASDGNFYGTTEQSAGNAGTVFRLRPDGTYTTLKVFDGTDGSYPRGTLVQGSDGILYGTTQLGPGKLENGTIFKINPDGSGFAVVKTFSAAEGIFPNQLLAAPDGYFYGTTVNGGIAEQGTLYRVRPDGTDFAVLKFMSSTERVGNLVVGPGGAVYSNLVSNGSNNLIRVAANGSLTIIRQFTAADDPGGLAVSSGNVFYCLKNTDDFNGAICRINADGSGFALLKTFTGTDGSGPTGLVQGSDGTLYGMTFYDFNAGYGTIFRLNPDGSGFAVLRNLSVADGVNPFGKLTIQRVLSLSSFTPAAGPIGTAISLFGQELAGATAVTIGGVPAPFTVVSNTQLTVTVSPGTTGGTIEVTTPAGTVTSQGVFTVTPSPAPVIANFTPKAGPAGTRVTITGTHFNYATAVHFNNVPAAFTYVSATVLTATVPAGNASGFVTVTTPGGKATSKHKFTLTPAARLAADAQPGGALSVVYFPNPFRQSFTLRVQGRETAKVPFRIYNPAGQVVVQGDDLPATQQVTLGHQMARGVYYLEVGNGADVKRYKLVKTN